MNILVCMKAVPATTQVQVDGQFRLQRNGVALQWNTADEAALEAALQIKGSGAVTVVTMGPKKLESLLQELYARGVDRAVLITDPAMAGADTYATTTALAAAVQKLGPFDLILCGRRAIDGETGQVPGMLAAALGIPCITNADKIEYIDTLQISRRLEEGTALLQAQPPLVVSLCEYAYTLRLPGIMAMRRAKGKQIEFLSTAQLDLPPENCGLKGSLTKVIAMDSKFPGLRKGPKEADIPAGVEKLLSIYREVKL